MSSDEHKRRDILQALAIFSFTRLLMQADKATAQPQGSPVKVDTKGLVAKIKFEAPLGGFLTEINVTSPTGIRQVKAFGGNDIAALIWDAIERKVAAAAKA